MDKIEREEQKLEERPDSEIMQELMTLYNRAIEYYSAVDTSRSESHEEYLLKLQNLFKNEEL